VRLVDGEQSDGNGFGRRLGITAQAGQKAGGHEPLGGDVEKVELAAVQLGEHTPCLAALQRRVIEGGAHAVGA
jgi:hypothetical protein